MSDGAKRLARLSLLTAVGAVLVFLTNLLPAGRLGLMALAGLPVCAAVMSYGRWRAAGVYAITAVLAALLSPGAAAISYTAFFGYYPILKSVFERCRRPVLRWGLKLALYLAVFAVYWLLARELLSVGGALLPWYILLPAGAVVFFVYDYCMTLVISFYIDRIARYFS